VRRQVGVFLIGFAPIDANPIKYLATQGPTILTSPKSVKLQNVIEHSRIIDATWRDADSGEEELFTDLMGWNPWERGLAEWAVIDADYVCRISSLLLWYRSIK